MKSYYQTLVDKLGEAGAKDYMKHIRTHRKAPGYFATLSKEEITAISKKGGKAKKHANQDIPDGGAAADPER